MTEERYIRYEKILFDKKRELEKVLDNEKTETLDKSEELSGTPNHPGDQGTQMYDKQIDEGLTHHASEKMDDIKKALKAIEEGTYGQCAVCGRDIPYERLEVIPETRYCMDHAEDQKRSRERPVEESVTTPLSQNAHSYKESLRKDTWEAVEEQGTSNTPSDYDDSTY
ncbi:TraR/DksA C4-type zinc finger protein [Salipaludibacillus agaradhaerens]|uniref:TraR/DksA C4-type zinc finger protein n=1 Tax=Salipaludibacillus agaradhaerens TaxID=76935 RepID=A0A9Q4FYD8_SALAG|nr:TraR/DksA C4-type zinc finger protein [Salipaludibacillus agaradhaerens]MCR6096256.1 TraR/DksA C4-type zinc finger protein [Salipaludibacillus agaradhaerens]MCR6114185.1 TraR/DksA C4-type zinc finger protein [Salipaludibacillus agaradhaerens]